ncbi:MAG: cytochrome b562 [Phycisphaeraceae bacterium]
MKRSSLYVLAAALLAAFTLALLPTQQPVSADEDGQKAIMEAMEVLNGNYRKVRRQMSKADQNADTANLLAEMIDASVMSKAHLPKTASTDELKDSYRVVMNKLIIALAQAENAALEGDNDKLREFVLEANQVKGEGHELFIADE